MYVEVFRAWEYESGIFKVYTLSLKNLKLQSLFQRTEHFLENELNWIIQNIQYLHFQIVLTDIEGLMDFLTAFFRWDRGNKFNVTASVTILNYL